VLEGFLAAHAAGFGVNDIAIEDPDAALEGAAGDAEEAGVPREALYLDKVHEALALDAAEAAVFFTFEKEGLDALAENANLGRGGGLLCVQIDAGGVGASAVLLIAGSGDDDELEVREAAAGAEEDLEAVDLGHAEVCNEKFEWFGVQESESAGAGIGDLDIWAAGETANDFLVKIEEFAVVIEDKNLPFIAPGKSGGRDHFWVDYWPATCCVERGDFERRPRFNSICHNF